MRPTRLAAVLCVALASSGCRDIGPVSFARVRLNPILDSLFVGAQSPPPTVTYFDDAGVAQIPPAADVSWSSADPTILGVNSATGRMNGLKRGATVVIATVHNVDGVALVVVSDTLQITLLLDTVYVMPGDTITVPVAVLVKRTNPPPVAVWFKAPTNSFYSIDSASGKLTATLTTGGPTPYIVHADSLVDTGAVTVMSLSDTTGGKFFYSVLGTAITHVGGSVRAANYSRSNGNLAFQLRNTYAPAGLTSQVVQIMLPDSVLLDPLLAPGVYPIDSLSPAQDSPGIGPPASLCSPPNAWAYWLANSIGVVAYSRRGGQLGITRLVTVPHGNAISGRFTFMAQRNDFYTDPLAVLSIHGTFVAPLVTDRTTCR